MKKRIINSIFISLCMATLWPSIAYSCGWNYTFRAYLDKRFWQPFSKYEKSLEIATLQKQSDAEPLKQDILPTFTGTKAYIDGDFDQARMEIESAKQAPLSIEDREELMLVDAKIDMRRGEIDPKDNASLLLAKTKLQTFLKNSQIPAWQSEARGWLARTHYLLGEYSSAAKIYLDELSSKDSIYTRESLITSLRILFPYNGSSSRLSDHLEEYFDTPAHALFVVNIVTNPIYNENKERGAMGIVAQKVLDTLHNHEKLFSSGELSSQLALALMRAAIYRGDTKAALSYARRIPDTSDIMYSPEYNWMLAACHFLQREYESAEIPLLKILNSKQASPRDKSAATQGLVGVYQKTNRMTDQLHAAFLFYQSDAKGKPADYSPGDEGYLGGGSPYFNFTYWPMGGWLFDLPYLLDVQLTDDELLKYLARYSKESKQIKINLNRRRTAFEMVKYALAVRYARQEKYQKAYEIYKELGSQPRTKRIKDLIKLYADTTNATFSTQNHLEAQFAYAAFLEEHSTQVFFNDMIWHGFQTRSFINRYFDDDSEPKYDQGFTRAEREFFLKQERSVRDAQEERWRAYHILNGVMEKAGRTGLGKRAAKKALKCLQLINTNRFGREVEILTSKRKLKKWMTDSDGLVKSPQFVIPMKTEIQK